MRPVDKGQIERDFNPYQDAQQPLVNRLGKFCSYCERWIASAIHVEHKMPKANYSQLKFKWKNFLLSCSNCNSGKSSGELVLNDYFWPDTDNTARAFVYDSEGRVFPNSNLPPELYQKAEETWKLMGLNRHPDVQQNDFRKPSDKDSRWLDRKREWQKAQRINEQLKSGVSEQKILELLPDILDKAMFSVWYEVFNGYPHIREKIIDNFKNTAVDCFDANYDLQKRPSGQI
jgi:uncharacterized protein (TIGR02646 family)